MIIEQTTPIIPRRRVEGGCQELRGILREANARDTHVMGLGKLSHALSGADFPDLVRQSNTHTTYVSMCEPGSCALFILA